MARLKAKIRFYQAMVTMLDAGVPIVRALKQQNRSPFTRIARQLAEDIEERQLSFADAATNYPKAFSSFEVKLFHVGEQSGRLLMILRSLTEWHEKALKLKKEVISKMLYPMFLFHMSAILLPILFSLFHKTPLIYVILEVVGVSLIPYLLFLVYKMGGLAFRLFTTGPFFALKTFPLYIPVGGTLIRRLDYMRFFYVYGLCLDAGLKASDAIRFGAEACRNSWIKHQFLETSQAVANRNAPFYEVFYDYVFRLDVDSVIFPMMETGEGTGKASETAIQVSTHYQQEAEGTIQFLAGFIPKLIYFGMVIFLAISIVTLWQSLFSKIQGIG